MAITVWIAEREPILEELEPLTHQAYKERDQVAQARANISLPRVAI